MSNAVGCHVAPVTTTMEKMYVMGILIITWQYINNENVHDMLKYFNWKNMYIQCISMIKKDKYLKHGSMFQNVSTTSTTETIFIICLVVTFLVNISVFNDGYRFISSNETI